MEANNGDNWTYEELVDEVDELIAKAFYESGLAEKTEDPLRCYLLLAILLQNLGNGSPGMRTEQIRERIQNYIDPAKFNELESIARQIAEKFRAIIEPTYIAASYWSPIDERRHTASYRRDEIKQDEEKRVLAYAYAFYALTFFGGREEKEYGYYSATQYTALHAERKRGVIVSYWKDEPPESDRERWWHIPKSTHQRILNEIGVTNAIEKYLLNDGFSSDDLRKGLRPMLTNRDEESWTDLNSFAADFIKNFPNVMSNISEETYAAAEHAQTYVNNLLSANLDIEKSLFMLMTNLIYDVAFPSTYFYAFPVRIRNLCSVVTVGTDEALKPHKYLSLERIATSIFMHPLLLDYATSRTDAIDSNNKMLLMGGCAHAANNALAMTGIQSLTKMLSKGEPPEQLRFSLKEGKDEDALEKLKELWMGGRVAKAFIALVEMATRAGALREKFTADSSYTLNNCLDEAEKMVNVHLGMHQTSGQFPQTIKIERDSQNWINIQFPKGYLEPIYIYTFLYELLLNVCKHGELDETDDSTLEARATISTEINEGELRIHVINRLFNPNPTEKMEWFHSEGVTFPKFKGKHKQSGSTFLQFASVVSKYIHGIKIKSEVKGENYIATLILNTITVDKTDGTRKRVELTTFDEKQNTLPSN